MYTEINRIRERIWAKDFKSNQELAAMLVYGCSLASLLPKAENEAAHVSLYTTVKEILSLSSGDARQICQAAQDATTSTGNIVSLLNRAEESHLYVVARFQGSDLVYRSGKDWKKEKDKATVFTRQAAYREAETIGTDAVALTL